MICLCVALFQTRNEPSRAPMERRSDEPFGAPYALLLFERLQNARSLMVDVCDETKRVSPPRAQFAYLFVAYR
jgi:hypothetical protein